MNSLATAAVLLVSPVAEHPVTEPPAAVAPARPKAAVRTPANACYSRALSELKLTPFGAVSLCSGTEWESSPLACYKEGLAANLSAAGAVLLCSGSSSGAEPAACYKKALAKNLSPLGAVTLCHAAASAPTRLECWDAALAENLTGHGAVQLCGGIPLDLIKQIYGERPPQGALPAVAGLAEPTAGSSPAP